MEITNTKEDSKNNLLSWLTSNYIKLNPFVDDKITKFL